MSPLGNTPANTDVEALWPTGMITGSVLAEADMAPHWLPCDGRRVSKTTYAALYAKLVHRFELTPGVDPGDGLFRLPPMMEAGANGSVSRIPAGHDAGTADVIGTLAGALGHTHAPGSLAMPAHSHGVGTLQIPNHGHGHSLGANHGHWLFNDVQPFEELADDIVTGTFESLAAGGFGNPNNPHYVVNNTNPGVGGSVNGSGALGASGAPGSGGAAAPTGASAAGDPAYQTLNWYVKK